jgi:uncharacterized protein (DUF362 family)
MTKNSPARLHDLNRREFLKTAAAAGAALAMPGCGPWLPSGNRPTAATAILKAAYDSELADVIEAGLNLVPPPDVAGKRVLLKPNLVDLPRENKPSVTNPALVIAAAEAFRRRGAAKIIVADGPALQRDAWQIVDAIGLTQLLSADALEFVDLNLADVRAVPNPGGNLNLPVLYYPLPVLQADVIVSLPKMKVHHWAGVTLSMKSMIGTTPGSVYGWPRNIFHIRDFANAIIDLNLTRPCDYAIVDGIVGMQGDGPIHGTAVDVGVIVMGDNPPAVDATATRIMGLNPQAVGYLQRAENLLGPIAEPLIEQRGETIASVRSPFAVLRHMVALTM